MGSSRLLFIAMAGACAAVCLVAAPALGDAKDSLVRMDQRTTIMLDERKIVIECALTLNRPGAYVEFLKIDADGDGQLSAEEQRRYFEHIGRILLANIELKIDGRDAVLSQPQPVTLEMPFTKRYRFEAPQPAGWRRGASIEFHNDSFLDAIGGCTIEIDPGGRADIVENSLWETDTDADAPALTPLEAEFGPQRRDVALRYREGTGRNEPPAGAATPTTAEVHAPGAPVRTIGGWTTMVLAAIAVAGGLMLPFRRPRRIGIAAMGVSLCVMAGAYASTWRAPQPLRPDDAQAMRIFQKLHANIYDAFKVDAEEEIYDVLSQSVRQPLLGEIYDEVYDAKTIRDGGAMRFDIRRVRPLDCRIVPGDASDADGGFRVWYRWRVYGTVSHYGHRHARLNEYEAVYTVAPHAGGWRIAAANVMQHHRINADGL